LSSVAAAVVPAQAAVSEAAASPVLAVKNIEVIYDHVILVLRGVSLEVPHGGIVALLGGNGAGKSTTLKSVSTLLAAERGAVTKGSIEFRGRRTDKLAPGDLDAVEADRAGARRDDAHQALERRALARAVAAEQRYHLVRLDAQRDVEQDVRIPVIGVESGDLEQAHAARTPPR